MLALVDRPDLELQWDFAPSEDTLREAAALRPEAFREPALWLRPGMEPVPIVLELGPPPAPATTESS